MLKDLLFKLWNERIFRISTAMGCLIIYLETLHPEVITHLLAHIINNQTLINAICTVLAAYLLGTKRF